MCRRSHRRVQTTEEMYMQKAAAATEATSAMRRRYRGAPRSRTGIHNDLGEPRTRAMPVGLWEGVEVAALCAANLDLVCAANLDMIFLRFEVFKDWIVATTSPAASFNGDAYCATCAFAGDSDTSKASSISRLSGGCNGSAPCASC